MRQWVEPEHVHPVDIEAIETNRLNAYYQDLLALSTLVLERRFFEDLTTGPTASFGLFIDMYQVHEAVVKGAFRAGTAEIDSRLTVTGQGSLSRAVDGDHAVDMRPDVVVRDGAGTVVAVADAKWKTGRDSSGYIY